MNKFYIRKFLILVGCFASQLIIGYLDRIGFFYRFPDNVEKFFLYLSVGISIVGAIYVLVSCIKNFNESARYSRFACISLILISLFFGVYSSVILYVLLALRNGINL